MKTAELPPLKLDLLCYKPGIMRKNQARHNEKESKMKPATSFKYFQYLLKKKLKQSSRQRKYDLKVP